MFGHWQSATWNGRRVHPCCLQAPVVLYWENIEGGHGGAANNKQRAHMVRGRWVAMDTMSGVLTTWPGDPCVQTALTYNFLAKTLGLSPCAKL